MIDIKKLRYLDDKLHIHGLYGSEVQEHREGYSLLLGELEAAREELGVLRFVLDYSPDEAKQAVAKWRAKRGEK